MDQALRFLADRLRRGKVCVVAGAGLTKCFAPRMPSTNELTARLNGRLERQHESLASAAQDYETRFNRAALEDEVVSALDVEVDGRLPLHDLLAVLPVASVVTTNYDELVEDSFASAGIEFDLIESGADLATTRTSRKVVKLHGSIRQGRAERIVITQDDYDLLGSRQELLLRFVETTLAEHHVLFLGSGLEDDDFRRLHLGLLMTVPRTRLSFAVQLSFDQQDAEYWKTRQVELIQADLKAFSDELIDAAFFPMPVIAPPPGLAAPAEATPIPVAEGVRRFLLEEQLPSGLWARSIPRYFQLCHDSHDVGSYANGSISSTTAYLDALYDEEGWSSLRHLPELREYLRSHRDDEGGVGFDLKRVDKARGLSTQPASNIRHTAAAVSIAIALQEWEIAEAGLAWLEKRRGGWIDRRDGRFGFTASVVINAVDRCVTSEGFKARHKVDPLRLLPYRDLLLNWSDTRHTLLEAMGHWLSSATTEVSGVRSDAPTFPAIRAAFVLFALSRVPDFPLQRPSEFSDVADWILPRLSPGGFDTGRGNDWGLGLGLAHLLLSPHAQAALTSSGRGVWVNSLGTARAALFQRLSDDPRVMEGAFSEFFTPLLFRTSV